MTAAFLPGLAPAETKREKVRRRVRPTSRAQYAVARERFKGRAANVLRWLAHHYNATASPPTSGELMVWVGYHHPIEFILAGLNSESQSAEVGSVLYIRRGLSDLQTKGLVESVPNGQRKCAYTGTKCETWRVVQR